MAVPTIAPHLRDSRRTDGRTGGDDVAIGSEVRWYDGRDSMYLFIDTAGLVRSSHRPNSSILE